MIVANFFFLKKTNGMYYYGLDYLSPVSDRVIKVLVNKNFDSRPLLSSTNFRVEACTFLRMVWECVLTALSGNTIFTPTSHPLPFIKKQWVTLHDPYPFYGFKGRLKLLLFWFSTITSRCRVGYINNSVTKVYLNSLFVNNGNFVFAPNRFPKAIRRLSAKLYKPSFGPMLIGLVGTDSPKKNYDKLFDAVTIHGLTDRVVFFVYGHQTKYYENLVNVYSNVDIRLIESDIFGIDEFIARIHVMVSVAKNEGFGRPIATSLLSGVPCFLIDEPVFREFYGVSAIFFESENDLVQDLLRTLRNEFPLDTPVYCIPQFAVDGYLHALSLFKNY